MESLICSILKIELRPSINFFLENSDSHQITLKHKWPWHNFNHWVKTFEKKYIYISVVFLWLTQSHILFNITALCLILLQLYPTMTLKCHGKHYVIDTVFKHHSHQKTLISLLGIYMSHLVFICIHVCGVYVYVLCMCACAHLCQYI